MTLTVYDLIAEVRKRGVTLAHDGGKLLFSPKNGLTPELIERLRSNRSEVISALGPVTAPIARRPGEKPNSQQVIRREATVTDDPRVVGAPHALGEALDDDWVERPDVNGKMGWEPRGVPESMRWWARSTFEDLPEGKPRR